ncbi:hypothetical protein GN156_22910 [bacterium LRH843]|uniref:cytochrome c oxidase subunit 6C n=1 Tax=Nilaparvata lugens TaxID=108931 RepID=UPI000B994C29|nr:cytochrome c oxidase subunit 6C [Nilaparvata lugens]NEU33535.1 hypothetical protein [bacterium LRH843]
MSAKAIAKPVMRRMLYTQTKKDLVIAIAASVATGVAYKFLVAEPRKQRYAEFYRNYDPNAAYDRMEAKGVFQDLP